ncbi:MAG: hypothetical protein JXB07_20940 [Anaerolineae bacterium]|nr:hypothetical protein [Anaerolineae bacterium]
MHPLNVQPRTEWLSLLDTMHTGQRAPIGGETNPQQLPPTAQLGDMPLRLRREY